MSGLSYDISRTLALASEDLVELSGFFEGGMDGITMQDRDRLQYVYDELACIMDTLDAADLPDEDDLDDEEDLDEEGEDNSDDEGEDDLNDEGEEVDEEEVMG